MIGQTLFIDLISLYIICNGKSLFLFVIGNGRTDRSRTLLIIKMRHRKSCLFLLFILLYLVAHLKIHRMSKNLPVCISFFFNGIQLCLQNVHIQGITKIFHGDPIHFFVILLKADLPAGKCLCDFLFRFLHCKMRHIHPIDLYLTPQRIFVHNMYIQKKTCCQKHCCRNAGSQYDLQCFSA